MRTGILVGLFAAALLLFGQAAWNNARYISPVDIAVSPDGKRLYIVCEGTDELLIVDAEKRAILSRVAVGRVPRGITLSGDRIYISNAWSDTVTEIDATTTKPLRTLATGYEPSGVAVAQGALYVANRISSDVSVIDLGSGRETNRLSAGRGASYVTARGSRVLVTHVYPNPVQHRTPPESEITEIDHVVSARFPLINAAGVFQVALSADGRFGLAGLMRPKNLLPLAHVAHGWAFTDGIAVFGEGIDGVAQLPLDELEHYFSMPFGVAIGKDKAYISATGSDEIAILDLPRLLEAARSPERDSLANDLSASVRYVTARVPVGRNPRGIALSPDGSTLYIANRLDDTISVLDTKQAKVVATMPLGGPTTLTPIRHGEQLFNTARFSFHGQFGCANCHIDATFDGLQWDLEPDGFGVDIVDNRLIEDLSATAPFKWNGGNPDIFTECGPRTERFFYRSEGLRDQDLADLVLYINSIPLRPNRYRLPNGELTPAQERGLAIFERTRRKNGRPIEPQDQCGFCHSGRYYTNRQLMDVGTGKPTDRSPLIDVPQLTNIALSAPYLHDGSARTLEEIWTVFNPNDKHGITNDLTKDELNDLIQYLKTL